MTTKTKGGTTRKKGGKDFAGALEIGPIAPAQAPATGPKLDRQDILARRTKDKTDKEPLVRKQLYLPISLDKRLAAHLFQQFQKHGKRVHESHFLAQLVEDFLNKAESKEKA